MAAQESGPQTTCDVPSAGYPTIQSAVDDPACTIIDLIGPAYTESIVISRSLAIHGVGTSKPIIDGGRGPWVLAIFGNETPFEVELVGLTIRNAEQGIWNVGGVLTVDNCVLIENREWGISNAGGELTVDGSVVTKNGGRGVYSSGGMLTINRSLLSENGGAISAFGTTILISNSRLSDNFAVGRGGALEIASSETVILSTDIVSNSASSGGGIDNSGRQVVISRSNLSGNVASMGGAISNGQDSNGITGTVLILDSVISANSANNNGGGAIYNGGNAYVEIANSTLSENKATNVAWGRGGAILNTSYDSSISIRGSTLYGNGALDGGSIATGFGQVGIANSIIAQSPNGGNCDGDVISLGYNIDSDGTCQLTAVGDQPNTDPSLGPLQNNGGLTLTHALRPGSPAIDAGSPLAPGSGDGACEANDQRGVARPQDGDGDGAARCDIGAYELWTPSDRLFLPFIRRQP